MENNQQTTKHDKLLTRQGVNEFIEKQHILFHLAIDRCSPMKEGVIFVQKAYYLSTPHLARSRTPKYHNKCMRACVRARAFVYVPKRERERERERERFSLNLRI